MLTSGTLQLILPYLQLDIKYYDLGLEYRDAVGALASRILGHNAELQRA